MSDNVKKKFKDTWIDTIETSKILNARISTLRSMAKDGLLEADKIAGRWFFRADLVKGLKPKKKHKKRSPLKKRITFEELIDKCRRLGIAFRIEGTDFGFYGDLEAVNLVKKDIMYYKKRIQSWVFYGDTDIVPRI